MDAAINHAGSDLRASSSDDRRFVGMTREEMELIVIRTFDEVIKPIVGNMTRKIVKEEIQLALEKLWPDKDRDNELAIATSAERRSLQIQFLDEVPNLVLTGDKLNGKDSGHIRLAVFDEMTGQLVASGPEASAKVEILILLADDNEDELNWSTEDFNKKIIRGRNKGKPHFPKNVYVTLKGGMSILCDVKLGNGSIWVKDCLCRLGARVVDNFSGSMMKEARTNSFMVRDCRIECDNKIETPSLSDNIWKLRNIGKGGNIDLRLQCESIYTVEDLLIRLLKDHDGLKKIVNLRGKKWEDMVKNARACASGTRMYCYTSQQNTSVVFNIHGEILGLYPKGQYAAAPMSSRKNKDIAGGLLSSAVGHWEDIFEFDDESSLQHHLSRLQTSVGQSDAMESVHSVGLQNVVTYEMIGVGSDTSSQGIIPNMASTQKNFMECTEAPFSVDDELIVHDLDIGPVQRSDLDPEIMVSNAMSEYSMNVDAATGGTGFMVAETFRNREETLPFDEASTSTSSTYLSPRKRTRSPEIHSMGGVSSFDDWPYDVEMDPFSFPSPATDSGLFFDVDPVPPLCWKDNIQYSFISIDGAKWGWDVLACILAYRLLLKRLVARRTHVQENSGNYC